MAKNYSYKTNTATTLRANGMLNVKDLTIDINGEIKSIAELLNNFADCNVQLTIKTVNEQDLTDEE